MKTTIKIMTRRMPMNDETLHCSSFEAHFEKMAFRFNLDKRETD